MTTRKGNDKKKGQKYQNASSFRNDLHNTSKKAKAINSLQVPNVCQRCKEIIEWKIKFKKYKPRTCPGKCTQCGQKSITYAYHTLCTQCALERKVCAKCGEKKEIVFLEKTDEKTEQKELAQFENGLKSMKLRERRTFLRQVERDKHGKDAHSSAIPNDFQSEDDIESYGSSDDANETEEESEIIVDKLASVEGT